MNLVKPIVKYYLLVMLILLALTDINFSQKKTLQNLKLKENAISQIKEGRYGEAIDLLNKYIAAEPNEPEGYNYRGLCFENRGQYFNAITDYRRAIALNGNYKDAVTNLNRVKEIWYPILKKKIHGHEREIAINPNIPVNYLEIGKSYRYMEEWDFAEQWYDKYLEKDPNASADEIIRFTEILAKTQHIKKGELILKKWLEKYPEDWRLWSKYGYFTMWLGNYKNAEKAFNTALGFKPFFQEALDGLDLATRHAYVTQIDPRRDEKEFPIDKYYRILRYNKKDYETRWKLVDELIKEERIEEAYQQLLILRVDQSNDPRFEEKWNYVVKFKTETYELRVADYKKSVAANPKDKISVSKLAEYYQYLEEYDSSYQVLYNYFDLVPDEKDAKLRFQYANAIAWTKDFNGALEVTDGLLKDYPGNLDYQLLRAQLSVWSTQDIPLAKKYLYNVLEKRSEDFDAILAMSSLYLVEQNFDSAQVYVDIAAKIDPNNSEVLLNQTNIEFQKMRVEEEKRFAILEEGRKLVMKDDCEAAIPYYEKYLAEAQPNSQVLKEFGDVLYCAKQYDRAIDIYDQAIAQGDGYDAVLQKGKVYYSSGDSTNAELVFKNLSDQYPNEFEPKMYLGDTYVKLKKYEYADEIYDTLLTWDLDSTQKSLITQRKEWVPPYGFAGVLKSFPASIGFAPSASFYSDNLSFRIKKFGGRLDLGINYFLTIGVSFFKTYITASQSSLDSATIQKMFAVNGVTFTGNKSFTTFKGWLFFKFSDLFSAAVGSGPINMQGFPRGNETEVYAKYEKKDRFSFVGSYLRSEGALILYSPYLIDLTINSKRLFASQLKFQGDYFINKEYKLSGYFQYINATDGNEGNDFMFRIGKYFDVDLIAGYEYYFANYKYSGANSPYYYSPANFESHSVWADYILEKTNYSDISIGGKLGYIPLSQQTTLEGHIKVYYKYSESFQLTGELSYGNTYRINSSYRYFGGSISAYWSL